MILCDTGPLVALIDHAESGSLRRVQKVIEVGDSVSAQDHTRLNSLLFHHPIQGIDENLHGFD